MDVTNSVDNRNMQETDIVNPNASGIHGKTDTHGTNNDTTMYSGPLNTATKPDVNEITYIDSSYGRGPKDEKKVYRVYVEYLDREPHVQGQDEKAITTHVLIFRAFKFAFRLFLVFLMVRLLFWICNDCFGINYESIMGEQQEPYRRF